jgi:citronellol/citronellal dehydrogenase
MASRTLKGKTLFITGASRGIGKAIALRAAKDGANIIIAAKTAENHPKLDGTIYTAAEEIEKAGGKALPVVVDVRDFEQIQRAVQLGVEKFGGIDIVVNNASAINVVGTLKMNPKTYDLMQQVNARGTYMTSKAALPYLLKAKNPHILNLSPPLNMDPKWFKNNAAYSIAKYGMSMCVLGMSEEFREEGVAVNALWPRTSIATAAVNNLLGGSFMMERSRTPEIMADAAHAILTRDSRSTTGQFFIDDEVVVAEGVKDLDKYCVNPKFKNELFLDFFLEATPGYTPMPMDHKF